MDQESIIKEAISETFAPVARLERLKALEYLRPDEVAELFPLPVNTLQKLRAAGIGPKYIKRSKSVYYKAQDVRDYLDAHRQQTAQ
jgi:hypothetical protein